MIIRLFLNQIKRDTNSIPVTGINNIKDEPLIYDDQNNSRQKILSAS